MQEKPLVDPFGRRIDYLRVSVTDRCNFRCVYCMPEQGVPPTPKSEQLTPDEICEVIRAAARLGMRKVRFTGGEPLLRKDLGDLISCAAESGFEDIGITTNGFGLAERAGELRGSGLRRVNVSLDTLREDRFATIARRGELSCVVAGIEAALTAGLDPVKINCVTMKGLNSDEAADFASWTLREQVHIRFIELMPIRWDLDGAESFDEFMPHGGKGLLQLQRARGDMLSSSEMRRLFVSSEETRKAIESEHGELQPAEVVTNGPARTYRLSGALGTVGFISQITHDFCSRCNRLRLTHDGFLRPCLMSDGELDLKPALRAGGDVKELFRQVVGQKPERHYLAEGQRTVGRNMSQIGG
ncbi:MAG TPA: GTP 3',8-cyclase MoaA [Fimbriimonas sp.]|nr:GTP 3',8-cyclase MoaA [Fimbriimonas sp.]